jgi:adsorption protein B
MPVRTAEQIVILCLPWLALWILISGVDDLFLDLVCLTAWLRRGKPPVPPRAGEAEKRTAVFVPLWHEDGVIGKMLEHNVSAIQYRNYAIFVGAYPNDAPTAAAVRQAEGRFPQVHLALCPHDGPTSKADCLNWIYQRMLAYEREHAVWFEVIVVHDAEDLIHPEELRRIGQAMDRYGMVQVPVLPLGTPFRSFTHGVYCDEFAEYQSKDVPARVFLGGFLPSNGVGTGYARWALEAAAVENHKRVFDPASLTEDYDIGFRLHEIGCPQLFIPIEFVAGQPVATREFFPRRLRHALRQRTRWVMGNALQAWERHGWRGGWRQAYWFWRDRKGLAGNLVTVLANGVFGYGLAAWLWSRAVGAAWPIGSVVPCRWSTLLLFAALYLLLHRTVIRCTCVARIYGWKFAAGVPLRMFWGNWINAFATAAALARYSTARLLGRPLVWFKTEHDYPSRAGLVAHKQPLGVVLVRAGHLTEEQLRTALATKPPQVRLGDHLVQSGPLSEDALYTALSAQQSVPFESLDGSRVRVRVARSLPGSVARRHLLIPFHVEDGKLHVAGPELPTDETLRHLRAFTRLRIEFHYITPGNFERLARELLGHVR